MSCVFCDIVNKKTDTDILFENEQYMIFRDIRPAVEKCHFLIIPKQHIPTVNDLKKSDSDMLLDMKKYMLELLSQHNQTDPNEISLGFHMPPFNSVKHLHLHGISPKSEMRFLARWIFRENTRWYKAFDEVMSSLKE